MTGLLESIWSVVSNLPDYLLYVIESAWNALTAVIEGVFSWAVALLPGLPPEPEAPGVVVALNWFFPVGACLSIATSLLGCYIAFLAVRFVFRKLGAL